MGSQSTQIQRPAAAPSAPLPPAEAREGAPTPAAGPRPWSRLSLLWRVFAGKRSGARRGVHLLAWAPVTVHRVATPSELVVLSVGLMLMLAFDLVLLRRAFRPLRRLAATMSAVDPAQPGRRAELFEERAQRFGARAAA